MDWKEFLKPTKGKIIIFVVLFAIITLISIKVNFVIYSPGERGIGLPLIFAYNKFSVFGEGYWGLSFLNLVINLIFWYLASCLFAYIYKKVKK